MGAGSCQAIREHANIASQERWSPRPVTLAMPESHIMKQITNLALAPLLFLSPVLAHGTLPQAGSASSDGSKTAPDVWTQAELEAVTAKIQKDVEEIRGQIFRRGVAVKLIDQAGFVKYAKQRMDETSTPESEQAEEDIAKMLALVPAEMNLRQAGLDLLEGQVGGFYDPLGNIFYLMESFTGGIAKVILSHELTHALDDQIFDLDGGFEERMKNRDSLSAYQALVEGSGTAAMSVWTMENLGSLDPEDLAQASTMGTDSLATAPALLWKPLLGSYMTGNVFLQAGYKHLKQTTEEASIGAATDFAFRSPPVSTEQVLHPEKYWDEDLRDLPVRVEPSLQPGTGWELLESTVLGELHLALITEEQETIDFSNQMQLAFMKYTNEAASGWGGDQLMLYGKGDARWLTLTTAWDTAKDSKQFKEAMEKRLKTWRAALKTLDSEGLGSGVSLIVDGLANPTVTLSIWYGTPAPAPPHSGN
jgi:hypothetical protein